MIPLEAIKYLFLSGILVISLFLAVRCLIASDYRREIWRQAIKPKVYFRQHTFKILVRVTGWICLLIALFVAYFQFLDLLEN